MVKFVLTLVLLASVPILTFAATSVEIRLSASDLDDQDVCCSSGVLAPDTYVIVSYAPSAFDNLEEVGRTSVIDNDNNPVWPQIFTFQVGANESNARVRFDLWDEDPIDSDDFIGYVELRLYDLINAFGNILSKPITSASQGELTITGRINGTTNSADGDNIFDNAPGPILTPLPKKPFKINPKFAEGKQ